jgi:dTDP-3-amino-2,3,6-trideoxy-4-keto-D-glucose/dTDP-3-amino-3,4,6-trideoxy-alpha-D-glucose/dTDP-2,6-dideoxy-D-kanosamine transaminase
MRSTIGWNVIKVNDPIRSLRAEEEKIREAIHRVLESGHLILGPENEILENELSSFLGVKETVLVGNGTDALALALLALDVKPGDLVITTANAGGYASSAIGQIGAEPFYVDIDPQSLQMCPESLKNALDGGGARATSIIVTHLYGQAADIESIAQIARDRNVRLVEDCAQALGARVGGKHVGTFGEAGTTSFYPTKNVGGIGDGGAVYTGSPELGGLIRGLRQYGWEEKYDSKMRGGRNSRMDEIQAAVVRFRLSNISEITEKRTKIYSAYSQVSSPWGDFPFDQSESFVAHLGLFVTEKRTELENHLSKNSVGYGIHYPVPDHQQRAYLRYGRENLRFTEEMAHKVLSVPLYPELESSEIEFICEVLSTS